MPTATPTPVRTSPAAAATEAAPAPEAPSRLPVQHACFALEIESVRQVHADDGDEGGAADDGRDDEVFTVTITRETPVRRWWGVLTLEHSESAIDMTYARNGLSLLLEHAGYPRTGTVDPHMHIGIVENFRLVGKATKGEVRFSRHELAQRIKQEVKDGTRRFVSVGQLPQKLKQTKQAEKVGEDNEYLATRWQPQEVSIVSVPAIANAKFDANAAGAEGHPVEVKLFQSLSREGSPMPETEIPGASATATAAAPTPQPMSAVVPTPASAAAPGDADRAARIVELCTTHGMQAHAAQWIREGHSVDAVGRMILDGKGARQERIAPRSAEELGANRKDLRRYSYARAALMATEMREGKRTSFDGVEAEVSQGIEKALPATIQRHGGILLPLRLERQDERPERDPRREAFAMGTGIAGGGAELVFDRPGELIDLLRNTACLMRMGAQVFTGLSQPVQYPKQTGDPSVVWMSENPASGAAASQLTFSTINLVGKTLIGTVPFPRQLLNLASFDVDAAIRNSLMAQHGLVLDRAGIHGKSTDGQPTGIYNLPGVAAVAFGGNATWDKLVDMETAVTQNNAFAQAMAYLSTPGVRGRLKKTLRASAAGSDMIWQGKGMEGEVAGWPAYATNQVSRTMSGTADTGGSEHGLVFGDWSQLIMAFWGAMELISDPITQAPKGQVVLTTFKMADIGCARPEAFAIATGQTA